MPGYRVLTALLLLAAILPSVGAQRPPTRSEIDKLIAQYLDAPDDELPDLEARLATVPALNKRDAKSWVKKVRKRLARKRGKKRLVTKGVGWFYDEKTRRGKYIVAGGGQAKGLVFGLHGGGRGSADCTSAASAWRGAIRSAGMIGIFPEAIEATEAAWGDEVTVRFVFDLLEAARNTFKFDPDRVYVVGHSMGGYGAWTLGGRFADRFAGAVSFAGSPTPVVGDGGAINGIEHGVLPNFRNLPLWVYHSSDDPRVPIPPVTYCVDDLRQRRKDDPKGYLLRTELVDGRGHAFPAKGPGPAIGWITKHKRQRHPRRVVWEPFEDEPGSRYWLEWLEPTTGGGVDARWDGKQSFEISGSAVASELALRLSDEMLNLDRKVKVSVDDSLVYDGNVERSLLVLLRSARERKDPGMLFTARLVLAKR